jgi:IPT/TIG domain-containing protein
MAKNAASEKRKKITAAVFGLLAVVFVYFVYQNFFSGSTSNRRPRPANSNQPLAAAPRPTPQSPSAPRPAQPKPVDASLQELLSDTTPLNLTLIKRGSESAKVGERGNIFAYFIPPPPPPPPEPLPPPITLQSVQPQNAVAGTPRPFTLTVIGQGFPADATVFMNGRPRQTKRVNNTTVTVEMTPGDYASAGNINVEVKSQSDPGNIWSRAVPLVIQAAPEPPFKYRTYLGDGDWALLEMQGTEQRERVNKGSTVQGVWRIDAVTKDYLDVTHIQYEIKRRINIEGKARS